MAVNTLLPEPILNPRVHSTHRDSRNLSAASEAVIKAFESATAATIAEGTANAGTATTAAIAAAALVTDYNLLVADGTLTADQEVEHLRVDNTDADFHTTLEVIGTASSEAEVKQAMYTYLNSLGQGGNVVEATLAAAALAAASVTEVLAYTFEENAVPTNTNDVTITAPDIVKNAQANTDVTTRTEVPIYIDVVAVATADEAAAEVIILGYVNALTAGDDVDQSAIVDALEADGDITSVTTCFIDITATPLAADDLVIAAGDIARTTAAIVNWDNGA